MLARFFVDADDDDFRGGLSFTPQVEQYIHTHVFIETKPNGEDADDKPDCAYEKSKKGRFDHTG